MSIKAMNWAWDQVLPVAHKIVLVALADHADNDGVCWPGLASIEEKTGVKKRTLIKVVQSLEADGLIKVERRKGGQGKQETNRYFLDLRNERLNAEPGAPDAPGSPGANSSDPGANLGTLEVQTVAPGTTKNVRTTIEPSIEPSARARGEIRFSENRFVGISDDLRSRWAVAFPGVNIEAELAKAALWLADRPRRQRGNLKRFIESWLGKCEPSAAPAVVVPSRRTCKLCAARATVFLADGDFCRAHNPLNGAAT